MLLTSLTLGKIFSGKEGKQGDLLIFVVSDLEANWRAMGSLELEVSKDGSGLDFKKFKAVFVVCIIALPVSLFVLLVCRNTNLDLLGGRFAKEKLFRIKDNGATVETSSDSKNYSPPPDQTRSNFCQPNNSSSLDQKRSNFSQPADNIAPDDYKDKRFDGLLPPVFDEESCLSRYQSFLYRKPSPHKPSAYLLSKLRRYEELHSRCGPSTEFYSSALKKMKSNKAGNTTSHSKCNYLVWLPVNGLGNRMVSMASSFLYALLTDRVLLVDHTGKDMTGLFCEPFPNSSWLLPVNFRFRSQIYDDKIRNAHVYGNTASSDSSSWLYHNLAHGDTGPDRPFYCDQSQSHFRKVPWLILLSDQYFAPSFFLMPSFREEVSKLFPEKDTVFHHLARYLFHPSNQVWGLIIRFYDGYQLAKAEERIGLQIRVFNTKTRPFPVAMDQILACTTKHKLLPQLADSKEFVAHHPSQNRTSKAILITSLNYGYYQNLSTMYWTRPTVTGEMIGVYQPSHEEHQHYYDKRQNMKALAEMYLLSLSDVLVTSAWSTFGYVAQGLGGLKPWILPMVEGTEIRDPPCEHDMSMEPCFHFPPKYNCEAEKEVDAGSLVHYLRHCKDLNWGVKLVSDHEQL